MNKINNPNIHKEIKENWLGLELPVSISGEDIFRATVISAVKNEDCETGGVFYLVRLLEEDKNNLSKHLSDNNELWESSSDLWVNDFEIEFGLQGKLE